jgi:hypothetical protein
MADQQPCRDTGEDTGVDPDRESATGTPLWVKVFGIIVLLVVAVLILILLLVGGHGPGGHT